MGQYRHPFVDDVQTPRGDRQPPATFKCCAEIPVTRKKCVAPPRRRECWVKPSLPRLKKERRREQYFRKLHGDMHTKCSEELHSRQKYRNKLVRELSVIVTCSRVPILDPVLVKPRSSTTVPPKCMQSQNLSLNTSQPRSIQ